MITIEIPGVSDSWDPIKEEFVSGKAYTLRLEHSLISLQIWEAKWKKPFMTTEKSHEEMIDYIRCMTINRSDVPDEAYERIPIQEMKRINEYINDPMSATKIYELAKNKKGKAGKNRTPTAEMIYYWMISCNIPPEYRKWHLNQLITLIRVFEVENSDDKMSKTDSAAWRRQQNAARRKALHTKG